MPGKPCGYFIEIRMVGGPGGTRTPVSLLATHESRVLPLYPLRVPTNVSITSGNFASRSKVVPMS